MDAAGPTNTADAGAAGAATAVTPSASGCPVDHTSMTAPTSTPEPAPSASGCPVDHVAMAAAAQAAASGCPVDHTALAGAPVRSAADRRMRKLLLLDPDAPRVSIFGSEQLFGRSIAISATRCLITYVLLPLLAPIFNLSGVYGPILGLVLGAVSMVAIVFSMRRFFAADHKYRWWYAGVGTAIFVALIFSGVYDLINLTS